MALRNGVVPEDWRSAMIVPLSRVNDRDMNYRGIKLLSKIGKKYM